MRSGRDIIVIGASAGGVKTIQCLLSTLPADLAASIFVVLHRSGRLIGQDRLPGVLTQCSKLAAETAQDGMAFEYGHVYVAPGNSHLLVDRGAMRIEQSPRECHSRPSVDVLFRSAALAYGRRVVGVLLTGMLSDGTIRLWQIRKHGGIAIVQDPDEAAIADMPKNAIENVPVHHALPVSEIGNKLIELAAEEPKPAPLHGSQAARVLIVEDERLVAMNLCNRLGSLGYEVVGSVASAESAVEKTESTMPDIILMDICLAGAMTGTEAARIIWQRYQVPVVYLTAYSDEKTLAGAKTSMPYGYLVKPYRPEQIHAAIQMALDRYEREMHFG